jgi:hypothetical protein
MLVLAWLEYVMVKIVSFSMANMCHGQNRQFQHVWNMSWSKLSVSACLELMVKIVSFRMAGLRHCQNVQFLHGWTTSWSKLSVSAWLE